MDERPPPVYATRPPIIDSDVYIPPPEYTFPASFRIAYKQTPPLVDSAQLKGHLALLHSFATLRSQVDELGENFAPLEDKGRKWAWFVSVAVER
jgi:hypothetical protein